MCPESIPVPERPQYQTTNLKHSDRWKDHGRKENAPPPPPPPPTCFLSKGLRLFGTACQRSLRSFQTRLPAQSLQLWIATSTGAGLILLPRASNHTQGKDVAQFSPPRNDRDPSVVMKSLEYRAALLYRAGSISG